LCLLTVQNRTVEHTLLEPSAKPTTTHFLAHALLRLLADVHLLQIERERRPVYHGHRY